MSAASRKQQTRAPSERLAMQTCPTRYALRSPQPKARWPMPWLAPLSLPTLASPIHRPLTSARNTQPATLSRHATRCPPTGWSSALRMRAGWGSWRRTRGGQTRSAQQDGSCARGCAIRWCSATIVGRSVDPTTTTTTSCLWRADATCAAARAWPSWAMTRRCSAWRPRRPTRRLMRTKPPGCGGSGSWRNATHWLRKVHPSSPGTFTLTCTMTTSARPPTSGTTPGRRTTSTRQAGIAASATRRPPSCASTPSSASSRR
mmetsp:Transcript_15904/g.40404  ORF Transcript_15904/g.40404 Transcript_15904/m.40404 type:complete len:260 (+) Transcript_15904:671-1450(+)